MYDSTAHLHIGFRSSKTGSEDQLQGGGGEGGVWQRFIFHTQKISTSEFVYQNFLSIPIKIPHKAVNCVCFIVDLSWWKLQYPKKSLSVFFCNPKKILASFIDPQKSLLAKIADPKKSFGPLLVIKIMWVRTLGQLSFIHFEILASYNKAVFIIDNINFERTKPASKLLACN